jgi:hypothetical protein
LGTEEPFVFRIIDFEGAIWWNVDGLDGGKVSPFDMGGRVGVRWRLLVSGLHRVFRSGG